MTSEAKIENNLFNDKKMEEFIHLYDDALTVNADCDPISYWIKKLENDELKNEKANYIKFFKIILENMLGYQVTDIDFEGNIGDEGRPVEFTLKKGDKDYVVVELKGTTCKDLNKRYNREQSPIEQVTNYASIKEETQWAFVSNYNEFRLFNPSYREKYISFKFKQLSDPEVLKKFLLIFSKFSLIEKDIPQTLLEETKIIERELEDEFYKLFSETRLMLIKELEHSSEDIDRIEAIRFAQLILNRFIFLCFAEDLRLIPSETTADVILTPIKHKNLFDFTMWDRLNELFRFADKGNEERGISAFNGGLFKESLRHLEIRDKVEDLTFFDDCYKTWKFKEKYEEIESLLGVYKDTLNPIYKNLLLISSFDFGSELSVNILGHIFENSIGDIEELKDETTERRKKEGVFYTPKYITDYMCRNTIIPYLSISGEANTTHELISEYEDSDSLDELDKKLKDVKIIDISCGSGAFLNKAVDVLFEIHKAYHDSKYANDPSLNKYFDSLDRRRQIIINNIYGVDVNEESVEITKLSLFLKLATSTGVMEGFKLPNLNENIKCGNSLVDNELIAGNKAFDWCSEYESVFKHGGFDIVIGNPPYINAKLHTEDKPKEREYLSNSNKYECLYKKWDIYIPFIEHSLKILKDDGFFGMIIPYPFIDQEYAKIMRKTIVEDYCINEIIDLSDEKIFKDATVKNVIPILSKSKAKDKVPIFRIKDSQIYHSHDKNIVDLIPNKKTMIWDLNKTVNLNIDFTEMNVLGEYCFISVGMVLNANEKKAKGEFKKEDLISESKTEIHNKEYIEGKNIDKYKINSIRYLEWNTDRVPSKIRRPTFKELYLSEKLLINKLGTIRAIYDKNQLFCDQTLRILVLWKDLKEVNNRSISSTITKQQLGTREELEEKSKDISLKYLLGIINSNMGQYLLNMIRGTNNKDINPDSLRLVPIPPADKIIQEKIDSIVDTITENNIKCSEESNSFLKWLKRTYDITCDFDYTHMDYEAFLKKIKKQNKKLNSRKNQDIVEKEFNISRNTIDSLNEKNRELEFEINEIVYSLYGLTDKEIAIIENSFNE